MNSSDILNRYKDKLLNAARADLDISEVNVELAEISKVISDELMVDNLSIKEELINCKKYIRYAFTDNGMCCSSAVKVNYEALAKDIADHLDLIVNGISALHILNDKIKDFISKSTNSYNIEIQWGFGNSYSIGYWDYEKAVIRISKKSLIKLVSDYHNGENTFRNMMESAIDKNILSSNIIEFIDNFNNSKLSTFLNDTIQTDDIDTLLSKNMMTKKDVIDLIASNKDYRATQNITVLYIVRQLGHFVVLQNWKVDYKNKSIITNILGDRVLDIDYKSVITNDSICSRIEHILDLDKNEVENWFN